MATHELYLGGGTNNNANRAQFPSPTFNASDAAIKAMRPSAHKGPTQYALTRTLDFDNDPALAHYVANNTIATGDVLNLIVIPANTLVYGVAYWVESPSSIASSTLTVKLDGTAAGTAVALDAAGSGFAAPAAVAWTTAGAASLATATFNTAPTVASGTLAITDEGDLKGLRVHVSVLLSQVFEGQG